MSGQLFGAAGSIGNGLSFKSLFNIGENNGIQYKPEYHIPEGYQGDITIDGGNFDGGINNPQTVAQTRDNNASQGAGPSAAGQGSSGAGGGGGEGDSGGLGFSELASLGQGQFA
jgi:hypothetical protein